MEFRYSTRLPTSEHPTGGLAGDLPLRRHDTPLKEDIGALRAQRDWGRLVRPVKRFKGGLSRRYGLMQVAVPECRPERLEVIAYASELGFLYDDCTEFFNGTEISGANDRMQMAFTEGVEHGKINSNEGGLKAMQAILFKEMIAIDKTRAQTAMKVWIEFLRDAAGRQHGQHYTSFAKYMEYRLLDVGEMFWFGLVTFGMALTVPESEIPRLRELTRSCWTVLALQNDFCSYEKECVAASQNGSTNIVNALQVLMEEQNIDLEAASDLCKQHIAQNVAEYQRIVDAHRHDETLSKDSRIYMESLLYTISGDAAWSLITPRYNAKETYNAFQMRMMEEVTGHAMDGVIGHKAFNATTSKGPATRAQQKLRAIKLAHDEYANLLIFS